MDITCKLKNREFISDLDRVKKFAEDIWQKDTIYHPEFTLHGMHHSKNVIENISKIIPVELLDVLSERDIYYLLCACYLHDIGMLFVPTTLLPITSVAKFVIRKIHGTTSRFMIHNIRELSAIFNDVDRSAIGQLCELHTGDLPMTMKSHLAHFPLLVAILRICDACDVTYRRSSRLFDLMKLETESYIQWAPLHYIQEVSLVEKNIVISATIPAIPEDSLRFLIEQIVINKLKEEASQINPILKEYNFKYTSVKLEISVDDYLLSNEKINKLVRNKDVINRLNEKRPLELKIISSIQKKPLNESELAEKIGISIMAIRNRIKPLIKKGIIYVNENDKEKRYEFLPYDRRKEFLGIKNEKD